MVVTDENVFRENLSRRFHYKAFGNRREYCGSLAMNYLKTDAVYNKGSMVYIAHKNITSAIKSYKIYMFDIILHSSDT